MSSSLFTILHKEMLSKHYVQLYIEIAAMCGRNKEDGEESCSKYT